LPISRTRWAAGAAALLLACALAGTVATARELPQSETAASFWTPRHPLDPLTEGEIRTATAIFKAAGIATEQTQFVQIDLNPPPKAEVLAYKPGARVRREAAAIIYAPAQRKVVEAVADLKTRRLLSSREVKDVQPPVLSAEYDAVPALIYQNPAFRAAMARRGITDMATVYFDVWAGGYFGIPDEAGHRVLRAVSYLIGDHVTNAYARPIEGVVVYVDPSAGQVLKVLDTGNVPVSGDSGKLDEKSIGHIRTVKPLVITQPKGVNFTVRGQQIQWQNWQFRWVVHPRTGLQLEQVGYKDGRRLRSILYNAALSEMVVPYADPDETFFWRDAFDVGEYGLGRNAHALEPGKECPANAAFFPAVFADEAGEPYVQERAVCVFERDGDMAWSHYDQAGEGATETRRAQNLVIRFAAVVGNYDYAIDWIFHQDGTLEQQTEATGILEPKGVHSHTLADDKDGQDTAHGQLVAGNIVAPYHQHFFNYRLDMDVDGTANSVVELNVNASPAGPANPYHNGFTVTEQTLATEQAAKRSLNMASHREWQVVNPNRTDALGYPVGYKLVTAENGVPYADPSAWVRQRAGFLDHHLFVTPFRADELYAAGDYPNQSKGGEGLPRWTAANRAIANQDVVLWYTMGLTHITRPEEWPVMPVHRMGFSLVPVHFFNHNPALDLPAK
jgi:primary-amine oxidase